MISFLYLFCLIATISCLILVDKKFELAFFKDPQRAGKSLIIAWCGLLVWDFLGVWINIFFSIDQKFTTGFHIYRDIPAEEALALFVIVYTPLLIWCFIMRKQDV